MAKGWPIGAGPLDREIPFLYPQTADEVEQIFGAQIRKHKLTSTIAFHLVGSAGYLETTRCSTLAGCGSGRTLDHVGVDIRYTYEWHTPLKAFIGLSGNGYTVDKANSMRIEPIL